MRLPLLCLLLALLMLRPAQADTACGEISVGMNEVGLLYYRQDTRWVGIDVDLLNELSRRTGCVFTIQRDSRIRVWAAIEAGRLAMTAHALPTPEREHMVRIIPYVASQNYLMLLNSLPASAHTPEGFLASSYRVGIVRAHRHGPFFDAWLDKMRAQGRVHEGQDLATLLTLLKHQRIQAIVTPLANWIYLRDEKLDQVVRALNWAGDERLVAGLAVSRRLVSEANFRRIEKALDAMHSDGSLEKIFRNYVPPDLARDMVKF